MTKQYEEVKLVTDGGCRGNPGPGAIAFILMDGDNKVLFRFGKLIGQTTNNKAEYTALIEGLACAAAYTNGEVRCYSDSLLVVKQVQDEWKIKDEELKRLYLKVLDKESAFENVTYTHLRRTHPDIEAADKIVNDTLDGHKQNLMSS